MASMHLHIQRCVDIIDKIFTTYWTTYRPRFLHWRWWRRQWSWLVNWAVLLSECSKSTLHSIAQKSLPNRRLSAETEPTVHSVTGTSLLTTIDSSSVSGHGSWCIVLDRRRRRATEAGTRRRDCRRWLATCWRPFPEWRHPWSGRP